jgi:hypothetical protein
MKFSKQLSRLAARTKELEDRAEAAQHKAQGELEQDVAAAREKSKEDAEALRKSVDESAAEVSAWWTDLGRSWDEHVAKMRDHVDQRRAEHDLKSAQRDAKEADDYAAYVIHYAYAATEEAEYALLDATLAHKEADKLAAEMQHT